MLLVFNRLRGVGAPNVTANCHVGSTGLCMLLVFNRLRGVGAPNVTVNCHVGSAGFVYIAGI